MADQIQILEGFAEPGVEMAASDFLTLPADIDFAYGGYPSPYLEVGDGRQVYLEDLYQVLVTQDRLPGCRSCGGSGAYLASLDGAAARKLRDFFKTVGKETLRQLCNAFQGAAVQYIGQECERIDNQLAKEECQKLAAKGINFFCAFAEDRDVEIPDSAFTTSSTSSSSPSPLPVMMLRPTANVTLLRNAVAKANADTTAKPASPVMKAAVGAGGIALLAWLLL